MPQRIPNPYAPLLVLLVDDDAAMRATVSNLLEVLGFQVLVAEDGHQAIQVGQQSNPDIRLVITDFSMPGLNGVETLDALREQRPGLKAILCSGQLEEDCLRGHRPLEDYVYLGKPFNLHDLDAAVTRVLGGAVQV
jgi:two-component system, cell cycle sensor histidine kinase and response regulator CckA